MAVSTRGGKSGTSFKPGMFEFIQPSPGGESVRPINAASRLDTVNLERGDLDLVREIYSARRERRHFFRSTMFADPAWDILLVMYCAHLGGEDVSVSSLVLATDTPFSTGLRWLKLMEKEGLLVRAPHPTDGRAAVVRLTEVARSQMEAYLQRLKSKDLLRLC